MPESCALCSGEGPTRSLSGLPMCDLCMSTDPTEWLAARGMPAVFQRSMLRFNASLHLPGVPDDFVLRCVPEDWTHTIAKLLVAEVQVGDPSFDDAIYVRTSDPEQAAKMLAPDGVQSAILGLLAGSRPELVASQIAVNGPTLTISVRPLAELDEAEWLRRQLETAALGLHWATS